MLWSVPNDDYIRSRETVNRVANANIVWANHDLLLAHFPFLEDRAYLTESNARVMAESWILENTAVFSKGQSNGNAVNSRVQSVVGECESYRPPYYGRAAMVEVQDFAGNSAGLVDIKGCGVGDGQTPSLERHFTGVVSATEAIMELLIQKFVCRILENACSTISSIPIYAIIDLGFTCRLTHPPYNFEENHIEPVMLIVRESHLRFEGNNDIPIQGSTEHIVQTAIEYLLRCFGWSSNNSPFIRFWEENGKFYHELQDGSTLDGLSSHHIEELLIDIDKSPPYSIALNNIQICRDVCEHPLTAKLVDFGQYEYQRRFELDVLFTSSDRPLNWGGIATTSDRRWIQALEESFADMDALQSILSAEGNVCRRAFETGKRLSKEMLLGRSRKSVFDELQSFVTRIDEYEFHCSGSRLVNLFGKRLRVDELADQMVELAIDTLSAPPPKCFRSAGN